MNPVVLVISVGATTPLEIIGNITRDLDALKSSDTVTIDSKDYPVYQCHIKTKYYENVVALMPYTGDIHAIPAELLKTVEAIILYFDAENRAFLEDLPMLNKIVEDNHIDLGILLTKKLYDESAAGLTYKEVKTACTQTFDLIELSVDDSNDDDDDDDDLPTSTSVDSIPAPYKEVLQALHNNVWSNIELNCAMGSQLGDHLSLAMPSMEEQLEAFDNLLSNIQNFKKVSASMQREQVLDEAEKIAQLFANILNED